MNVVVNGEPASFPAAPTITDLVGRIGCGTRGVAVAVNAEVVPRSYWSRHHLDDGDVVEVLHAMQGG